MFKYVRKLADFRVKLLVSVSARFSRFAFPNQRRLVATPRREMTVKTVVRDVDLAAAKPLRVRRIPLEHGVPLFKPMKLLGHPRPESFRIRMGFGAQSYEFRLRLDVRLRGKLRWWREDPFFLKH